MLVAAESAPPGNPWTGSALVRWDRGSEALDRLGCRRGEEVDEVALRVADQQGPVAPRHGRRLLHDVELELILEPVVLGIDVGDEELDDHGPIRARFRDVLTEGG